MNPRQTQTQSLNPSPLPPLQKHRRHWGKNLRIQGLIAAGLISTCAVGLGQDANLESRIDSLETTLQQVLAELEAIKSERDALKEQAQSQTETTQSLQQNQQAMIEAMEEIRTGEGEAAAPAGSSGGFLPAGLRLGGYGEHHFNFTEGDGDIADIHRMVAYVGYEFADWASFHSETEIEHAFVNDGHGEVVMEQFYFDLNFIRPLNLRAGRVLHPAGIINRLHEPTTFYGVERPTYSRNVLPSTWSVDGAGLWGSLTDWLSYEVYVHAGLDGSGFGAGSGIRGGRIKERPTLNDPGVSGRVDFYPFTAFNVESPVQWRTGFSFSHIGTENANNGPTAAKPDSHVQIFAFDTDLSWGDWEFRGEAAFIDVPAAHAAGVGAGAADEIFGAYAQLAYHCWPEAWATGRFEESDAVVFARYDYSDTQHGDVPGGARNRARSLKETTLGVAYYPVDNLVFKADYTWADTVAGSADNRFDLGVGYHF